MQYFYFLATMNTFARFTSAEDAYLVKSYLGWHGIETSVLDEYIPRLFWMYADAIGGVRLVLINPDDVEDARKIYLEYVAAISQKPACVTRVRLWPLVLIISWFIGGPFLLFGRHKISGKA